MKFLGFALAGALALSACDTPSTSSSSSAGLNRVMDITNRTGVTMTRFYASNSGRDTWGPDQLGNSVLGSGRLMTIDFDDGTGACQFDFRAQFADGDVLTTTNINVCVESGWTYK